MFYSPENVELTKILTTFLLRGGREEKGQVPNRTVLVSSVSSAFSAIFSQYEPIKTGTQIISIVSCTL